MTEQTESDDFERWLNTAIESPAAPVLDKIGADAALAADDWKALAMYVAALDLRTPSSYLEMTKRWETTVPAAMDEALRQMKHAVERATRSKAALPRPQSPQGGQFPVRVRIESDPVSDIVTVRTEVTSGRELWLHSIRRLLVETSHVLKRHRWIIVRPNAGSEWFTSDHPVVRLNYYSEGRYDFGGGWGRKNGEILVPLTPHCGFSKFCHHSSLNSVTP